MGESKLVEGVRAGAGLVDTTGWSVAQLAKRYWPVLQEGAGPGHGPDLQPYLYSYRFRFEEALRDLLHCVACEGRCRSVLYTSGGTPMYLALDWVGIENGIVNAPVFKAFYCPGVAERKEAIKSSWQSLPVPRAVLGDTGGGLRDDQA